MQNKCQICRKEIIDDALLRQYTEAIMNGIMYYGKPIRSFTREEANKRIASRFGVTA